MQRLGGIVNPSSPTLCMEIAYKGRNISILTHREELFFILIYILNAKLISRKLNVNMPLQQ